MRRIAVLSLAAFALLGAGTRPSVPTVMGLRPGMTGAQALAIMRAQRLEPRAWYRPCLHDYLAQHRKVVSAGGPGRCLQSLTARYAGGDIMVFLSEDLPSHPGRSRVEIVALNYVADSAMSEVMRQAGAPTITDGKHPWTVAMWCFGFKCTSMDLSSRAGAWLLVHRGSGLTLEDNRFDSDPVLIKALAKRGVTLEP